MKAHNDGLPNKPLQTDDLRVYPKVPSTYSRHIGKSETSENRRKAHSWWCCIGFPIQCTLWAHDQPCVCPLLCWNCAGAIW